MTTKQQNHQQGAVMTLNNWSMEGKTFSLKLNMPLDVTEQMIDGYIATQAGVMTLNAFSMEGIRAFDMDEIQTFQYSRL